MYSYQIVKYSIIELNVILIKEEIIIDLSQSAFRYLPASCFIQRFFKIHLECFLINIVQQHIVLNESKFERFQDRHRSILINPYCKDSQLFQRKPLHFGSSFLKNPDITIIKDFEAFQCLVNYQTMTVFDRYKSSWW